MQKHLKSEGSLSSMNIVVVGHVDHGKSTVIGRLLADTHALPQGKLEQIRSFCERNSRPFEYAFLLDALRDERAQGITIDSARVFFRSPKRNYIIIDAPGHIEFLKNMITGASRASAALLVIDAKEGIRENSKRHAYLLSILGIDQILVLVNKMDLIQFSETAFNGIVQEFSGFLKSLGVEAAGFIPVSGYHGDNLITSSPGMKWYKGRTVLESLDQFSNDKGWADGPFRMPVQDIYKFTNQGDDRRIVAGTVVTGSAKAGDEVIFYPSGKRSRIQTVESQGELTAGRAVGVTLTEQIYITRGEIMTLSSEPRPEVAKKFKGTLFWLGKNPAVQGKDYILKIGTARVTAKIEKVLRVIDASTLDSQDISSEEIGNPFPEGEGLRSLSVQHHEVAECLFTATRPIAFDLNRQHPLTSRFVLVDDFEIRGGGTIQEAHTDNQTEMRENAIRRNVKWEMSGVSRDKKMERYRQKPTLILITGPKEINKKNIARALEARLFDEGRTVYYLGIGNVIHGMDADLREAGNNKENNKEEHLRRLAEISHILLDAGMVLIVTASELSKSDLSLIHAVLDPQCIQTIWIGNQGEAEVPYDLRVPMGADFSLQNAGVELLTKHLQEKGVI